MKHSLVLLDTDHIKKYVFATDKLKEIRGASALFDELNRITMKTLLASLYKDGDAQDGIDHATIYANGGAGLFLVPAGHEQAFIDQVRQQYHDKTITGSVTGVSVELPDKWQDAENEELVCRMIQRLLLKLQMQQAQTAQTTTLLSHALLKECEACHTEYATEDAEKSRVADDNARWLCRSCVEKRQKDQGLKQDIPEWLAHPEQLRAEDQRLWPRLITALQTEFKGSDAIRPEDLNLLGRLSKPENYVGLIYADGNNMGSLLDQILHVPGKTSSALERFKTFSTGVDDAIRGAVTEAIRQHLLPDGTLLPDQDHPIFPFDILLLGGDDLVMVTTAHTAIDTAITLVNEFHARTGPVRALLSQWAKTAPAKNEPTLSVSVMLAHAKFPFGPLRLLAESALKFAKKEYAERCQADQITKGMINFMVIHGSNSLDFEDVYARDLRDKEAHLYRTLRPYTVEDLEDLRDCLRGNKAKASTERVKACFSYPLHGVPKAKLHQLREAVSLNKKNAMLNTFATLIRAKEKDKRSIMSVIEYFAKGNAVEYPWFIKQDDQTKAYYTPLLDAIELYDFMKKQGEEDTGEP